MNPILECIHDYVDFTLDTVGKAVKGLFDGIVYTVCAAILIVVSPGIAIICTIAGGFKQ